MYKNSLAGVLLLLTFLAGCGGSGSTATETSKPDSSDNTKPEVTLVSIHAQLSNTPIQVGDSGQVKLAVKYSDDTTKTLNTDLNWQSSDAGVASVDSSGVVTAFAQGQTVLSTSYQGLTTSINLVVEQATAKTNLSMNFDAATSLMTLSWSEQNFTDKDSYLVQQKSTLAAKLADKPDDNWETLVEWPAGLGEYLYQTAASAGQQFRVVGSSSGTILTSTKGNLDFKVPLAEDFKLKIIQSGQLATQPLSGSVELTIDTTSDAVKVDYFVDTKKIGSSNSGPAFSYPLVTNNLVNGPHRIDAQIEHENDSFILISETVNAFNTNLALSFSAVGQNDVSSTVAVTASASSRVAISRVEFYLNQQLQLSLTEPNHCGSRYGCGTTNYDQYRWNWATVGLSPNTYDIKVIAYDDSGAEIEKTHAYQLNNKPTLTLTSPLNQSLVSDSLTINGTANDDEGVPLITVKLGDILVYADYANEFNATHSMAGLPSGTYLITVEAKDASGQVTRKQINVLYSSELSVTPQFIRALDNQSIIDIQYGRILYTPTDDDIVLGSVDTALLTRIDRNLYSTRGTSVTANHPNNKDVRFKYSQDNQYAGLVYTFKLDAYWLKANNEVVNTYGKTSNSEVKGGYYPVSSSNKIVYSTMHSFSPSVTVYDINTDSAYSYSRDKKTWLSGWRRQTNDEWMCNGYYDFLYSEYNLDLLNYESGEIIEITQNNQAHDLCIGLTATDFIYTSFGSSSEQGHLYKAAFSDPMQPLELSSTLTSSNQVFSTGKVTAWIEGDSQVLKVYINDASPQELTVANNAVLKKLTNDGVTYSINNQLYIWRTNTQTSKLIWPASDTHYIDGGNVYVIRGGNLLYKIEL